MTAVLRVIAYVVVGLLGVVVIGGAAIFGADSWRASNQRPPDCDFLLHRAGGDLLGDADVVSTAWSALTDPDIDTAGDLVGSGPVIERSCLLWAGTAPAGRTVVFVDTTVAGYQSLSRIVEVLLPAGNGGRAERAVVTHSTLLASEFRSGAILPLSGLYIAPDRPAETTSVTVLSSADGWQAATPAAQVGEGLFDIGVTRDWIAEPDDPQDPDALLLLELADGDRMAVAIPVGPERTHPLPVRATYVVTVDAAVPDVDALRAAGPVLSLASSDARYPLLRDRAIRPTAVEVRRTPGAVTLSVGNDPQAGVLPSFVLPVAPALPAIPLLPTG